MNNRRIFRVFHKTFSCHNSYTLWKYAFYMLQKLSSFTGGLRRVCLRAKKAPNEDQLAAFYLKDGFIPKVQGRSTYASSRDELPRLVSTIGKLMRFYSVLSRAHATVVTEHFHNRLLPGVWRASRQETPERNGFFLLPDLLLLLHPSPPLPLSPKKILGQSSVPSCSMSCEMIPDFFFVIDRAENYKKSRF